MLRLQHLNVKTLRVLTIAQYLKGADAGSYDLDEGAFVSDFLDTGHVTSATVDSSAENTMFELCKPLIDSGNETIVIDAVDLNCLYYLGGYVVSCIKKHDVLCDACLNELCVQEHEFVDESVTKLLLAKEYWSGCLIPCSQAVFDFVVAAEMAFRTLQHKLLSSKGNVKQNVMSIIAEKTSDINFSTCHDVKNKLIKRYVNARL